MALTPSVIVSDTNFRWGIVGTGQVAARFTRQLSKTHMGQAHAVVSRSPERSARFAKACGVTRTFASYQELLEATEIDVVYLATPTRDHLEHCLKAIEHGKAVLCEKPLALNRQQGEQIVTAARKRGIFCMEGMWMRFHPLVQRVREMVHSGELGDIHYVHAQLGWAKSRNRVEHPELGRGARLDFGVYPLSFVHYLLGAPDRIDTFVRRHPAGGDETLAAQLVYPTCVASIAASVSARLPNDAVVVGSDAVAHLGQPLLSPRWVEIRGHDGSKRSGAARAMWRAIDHFRLPRDIGFRREAEEVMRCLATGKLESEVHSLEDSLWVLDCLDRFAE